MPDVAARTSTVKAVPVNGLVQFVSQEVSADQLKHLLETLPPEQRKFFSGHLLATEQVPLMAVNDFTRRAAEMKGEPVKSFGKRAGRFGAELGVKSVYRFLLMVLSIDFVLKQAPFMWSRVYDSGVMKVDAGDGKAKITVSDHPADEAGCARVTGWFEMIGEKAGAKDLRTVHTRCMTQGANECVWDFTWTK